MDIEKLIDRLSTESLYADKASLEIMELCMEAAAALSALRPVSRERVEKVWRGEWTPGDSICPICEKKQI